MPKSRQAGSARLADHFRHLLGGIIVQLRGLVVMRRQFAQPGRINLDGLAHVLLGGEDQFMVQHPAWILLKQAGVWMDQHGLLVLHGLILASLGELGHVVEVSRRDGLPDGHRVAGGGDDGDFDAFHELLQLVPNVVGAAHAAGLDEVFAAPLLLGVGGNVAVLVVDV